MAESNALKSSSSLPDCKTCRTAVTSDEESFSCPRCRGQWHPWCLSGSRICPHCRSPLILTAAAAASSERLVESQNQSIRRVVMWICASVLCSGSYFVFYRFLAESGPLAEFIILPGALLTEGVLWGGAVAAALCFLRVSKSWVGIAGIILATAAYLNIGFGAINDNATRIPFLARIQVLFHLLPLFAAVLAAHQLSNLRQIRKAIAKRR